jgi:anthrax edema toxin adenylate cyclase
MSEVQESECGVVRPAQIKGAQRTMQEENAFLFLRPTELDSTRLIRAGYATKSMDIRDKSSNWGPMGGFVPCDPAFSKLAEGQPDPRRTGFDHIHGEVYPVQLFLTDELVATFIKDAKIAEVRSAEKFARIGQGENHHFKAAAALATAPNATLFALSKAGNDWLLWWNQGDDFHTLFVWRSLTDRKLVPTTGDYDVWMVAPAVRRIQQRLQIAVVGGAKGQGETDAASLANWCYENLEDLAMLSRYWRERSCCRQADQCRAMSKGRDRRRQLTRRRSRHEGRDR